MGELLTANQAFQGVDGKPIVNGFIYVGIQNADPVLNPLSIFSDRALTIPLANPQRTNTFGRPIIKIWGTGRYSVELQDENNVQIYADADTGELSGVGLVSLTNVQGLNAITAEGVPAIANYVDKTLYTFTTAGINTGDVTLNIDNNGVVPVLKEHNLEVAPGNFEASQIVVVSYNSVSNVFEVISQVANDGQLVISLWSGTVATIPQGWVICDGTLGTPDLRNSFIIGAGSTHIPGATGGATVTGGTVLTVAQLAAHFHVYTRVSSQSQNAQNDNDVQATNTNSATNTTTVGGDEAHTHPQNLPPFYALAYIMKL